MKKIIICTTVSFLKDIFHMWIVLLTYAKYLESMLQILILSLVDIQHPSMPLRVCLQPFHVLHPLHIPPPMSHGTKTTNHWPTSWPRTAGLCSLWTLLMVYGTCLSLTYRGCMKGNTSVLLRMCLPFQRLELLKLLHCEWEVRSTRFGDRLDIQAYFSGHLLMKWIAVLKIHV